MSLWIPSKAFLDQLRAAGTVTSGSTYATEAWGAAKAAVADAVDGARYIAGFMIGALEGAYRAVLDLFQGAAEMLEAVLKIVWHFAVGNLGAIKDMLMVWVDKMKLVWNHRGEIADDFLARWNAESLWDRGQFQGEVLGWLMMTILLMLVTMGESTPAAVAGIFVRWPQLVKLLKTVDALGDVATYLGAARKLAQVPQSAAAYVAGKLGRSPVPSPKRGPGAAHIHDESFSTNRTFERSVKHGGRERVVGGKKVAKEPADGQSALDFSFQISNNSPRRIGIDVKNNEFVVLDRTGHRITNKEVTGGVFHGHVRMWDELDRPMQKLLEERGFVKNGRISVDPARWVQP
jgi:hypothetical protein